MKRFVSYLYSVYNNQKIHNAGFARIELRTGRNRIDIHLQENGYTGKSGTVYLFIRNQKNIQGIPIGNIIFRNNQADFRYERPEENIGQTSWQIMQMSGIVIQIEDRIAFLSQWDEEPVDTNLFEVWDPGQATGNASGELQPDQPEEAMPDMLQSGQNESETVGELHAVKPNEDTSDDMDAKSDQAQPNTDEDINQAQPISSNTNETATEINFSAAPETPVHTSTIHTAEITPQPQLNRASWEQTWRYMLRTYPVMNLFAKEDNVLCVRIEIKDVRLLPEKYWSIVNNSFLLHGFFNYRYLAFGRIGQNWFIGIPGIYQNQEHVMASIFGFPDFLSQAQKNERGEQPGYWYRTLKI